MWRAEDRFAFCSTSKLFLAAFVLAERDASAMQEVLRVERSELVAHSPVTEQLVGSGITVERACEAVIEESDNTAANMLFALLGGPAGFQQRLRGIGDTVTRCDRTEPDLSYAVPGDERDTTTAPAWNRNLEAIFSGDRLPAADRSRLIGWMSGNAGTASLLPAAAPEGWKVADKSGAGNYATRNDIAVVHRDGRAPVFITVLSMRPQGPYDAERVDEVVAEAGRVAMRALFT